MRQGSFCSLKYALSPRTKNAVFVRNIVTSACLSLIIITTCTNYCVLFVGNGNSSMCDGK